LTVYFTSEGKEFFKKYGNVSDYGSYGLAAPNLSFTKDVWRKTGFSGVRYNGDNMFQKRISEKHFRAVYIDNAVVLHAHSYKTYIHCLIDALTKVWLGQI